jgi:hypothetical protein
MLLVIIVAFGVSIYSFIKGYYFAAIASLFGISNSIGFIAFILASIYLFIKGQWVVGIIPLVLIAWNLIGTKILKKRSND